MELNWSEVNLIIQSSKYCFVCLEKKEEREGESDGNGREANSFVSSLAPGYQQPDFHEIRGIVDYLKIDVIGILGKMQSAVIPVQMKEMLQISPVSSASSVSSIRMNVKVELCKGCGDLSERLSRLLSSEHVGGIVNEIESFVLMRRIYGKMMSKEGWGWGIIGTIVREAALPVTPVGNAGQECLSILQALRDDVIRKSNEKWSLINIVTYQCNRQAPSLPIGSWANVSNYRQDGGNGVMGMGTGEIWNCAHANNAAPQGSQLPVMPPTSPQPIQGHSNEPVTQVTSQNYEDNGIIIQNVVSLAPGSSENVLQPNTLYFASATPNSTSAPGSSGQPSSEEVQVQEASSTSSGREVAKKIRSKRYKATPCPICDKIYCSNYAMKKHVAGVHMKIRSFKCLICENKSYTQSGHLRYHMKANHRDNARLP